jgi:hypothetical protein
MLAAITTASRSKCSPRDDLADRLAAASMRWGSELELNADGSRTAFRQNTRRRSSRADDSFRRQMIIARRFCFGDIPSVRAESVVPYKSSGGGVRD